MIQLSLKESRGRQVKLLVIGVGGCGGRLAEEFARLNKKARARRGLEIVTEAFAVDVDQADLESLRAVRPDPRHRILIESPRTDGEETVRMSEIGAGIINENSSRVLDTVRAAGRLFKTDAFLLIASVIGSTGSGGMPVIAQALKNCYQDKPVYALAILPFQDEESREERITYNAAISLKTIHSVADAVFVADNQRYVSREAALREKPTKINELVVEPFYNLLCAGEEEKSKYIGTSMADFGNIRQTLSGWSAIGCGQSPLPSRGLFGQWRSFRSKATERQAGIPAVETALSRLTVDCRPGDAEKALYLVAAPAAEMRPELLQELGGFLKGMAPGTVLRSCDYPRGRGELGVTLLLSGLSSIERVKGYYDIIGGLVRRVKKRRQEAEKKARAMEAAAKKLPSLL
jgi:cell division GTPase FtsZ